ncbi:MAG TPA: RluA family pseudouridine synthase [Bryobacteraceae bacterium]|jgi:23S rRNA pseudouridine1911/1915/1917 synthase
MRFSAAFADAGKRLDQFLRDEMPQVSRSRIQEWIRQRRVLVNGQQPRASYAVRSGDTIDVKPAAPAPAEPAPEAIPLTILYEDADVVAIDKPAGMVVHAGAGIAEGTLVNALLARYATLSSVGGAARPGIVHRLDRYTSGVLLVARNDAAHHALSRQFSSRHVEKVYIALVHGSVKAENARIDKPIARDPIRRTRMTTRLEHGRAAWTEYRVLRRFPRFTLVEARIGTGRTHQIRVHFSSIGHAVVGDTVYGASARPPGLPPLGRYFLHAHRIRFRQPLTGEEIVVESPLPAELKEWLRKLEESR